MTTTPPAAVTDILVLDADSNGTLDIVVTGGNSLYVMTDTGQ